MADEAFALSPISARATLPSEEDYEAISQAFMETSRGRWFLGEYAKRNRNADTSMVLDAVARIEESLAAQRSPPPDNCLPEALAAIRTAVEEARAAADAALDGLALEQHLAPVRKGARVIREIAWRLREIGADGRICDLIDSQLAAIEAGSGQISSAGAKTSLSDAFDLIEERIAAFGDAEPAPWPAAAEAAPTASTPASDDALVAAMETTQAAPAPDDVAVAMSSSALPPEPDLATAEAAQGAVEAAEVTAEVMDATAEAADAHDDALLDMIAVEMAAPDPSDNIYDNEADEIHAAELVVAEPDLIAELSEPQRPEPVAAPPPPAMQPSIQSSIQSSLGSSLIESGIVRRHVPSVSDPLAPIRRMSQAEKIAFCS